MNNYSLIEEKKGRKKERLSVVEWPLYVVVVQSLSRFWLFATPWAVAQQAPLCPWGFPGKNIGMGCHFLLQGILPIQGSNLDLTLAGGFFTTREAWLLYTRCYIDIISKFHNNLIRRHYYMPIKKNKTGNWCFRKLIKSSKSTWVVTSRI